MSLVMDAAEAFQPIGATEPEPGAGAPPILRLDAAHLAEMLDHLGDHRALASGLINVIGLDGVAERLGPRWSARRELVYDHVERVLERQLGPDIVYQRIGETHFVVVQSGRSRIQAQGLCLRCLKEILEHFLGEARLMDLRLHEVTGVTANEIVGRKVGVSEAGLPEPEPAPDPEPSSFAGAELARSAAPQLPMASLVARWSPFVAANGRTVRVSCVLEPVVNLASSSRIGFRLARRVLDLDTERVLTGQDLRNLSRADIARVDYATIARGLDRLHAEGGQDKLPTLIVPVSYATLSNQRTRETLVALLAQARAEVRHGLVCEICDLDGVPPSALLTAVSLIRPFCVRVLASVTEPRLPVLRPLRGLGLDGVSMDCPPNLGDAEFLGWVRDASRASRPIAQALFLYRVASLQRGALASLSGATHVSLASVAKTPDNPAPASGGSA
jgi:hypothetical protein